MPKELSREEQQRGSRKAYEWMLVLGPIFAMLLVLAVALTYFQFGPGKGMEETATKVPLATSEQGKQALGPATVKAEAGGGQPQHLVDEFGHSLYFFKADKRGAGGQQAVSKCYDHCVKVWPPLLTSDAPKAGDPVKPDLLSVIDRTDGAKQVTYNGWPLYRFARDRGPTSATGNDVSDFGAEWHLLSPSGEMLSMDDGAGSQG